MSPKAIHHTARQEIRDKLAAFNYDVIRRKPGYEESIRQDVWDILRAVPELLDAADRLDAARIAWQNFDQKELDKMLIVRAATEEQT